MNGRNMVLPNRDRVEKWAVDMVRIELLLIWLQKVSKSLLRPSGAACNDMECVCGCVLIQGTVLLRLVLQYALCIFKVILCVV